MTKDQYIKKAASFFEEKDDAEEIVHNAICGDRIANAPFPWTLGYFVKIQEQMYMRRVKSKTPHKLQILKDSLASIQGKNPAKGLGVEKKSGWASLSRVTRVK